MDPAIKAAYIVYGACQISGNSLVLPHLTSFNSNDSTQTALGFTVWIISIHSLLKSFRGLYVITIAILLYLIQLVYFYMLFFSIYQRVGFTQQSTVHSSCTLVRFCPFISIFVVNLLIPNIAIICYIID